MGLVLLVLAFLLGSPPDQFILVTIQANGLWYT